MQLSAVRPSVRPSVCPIYRSLPQRAAGLLPWTPLAVAGDVGRLLHGVSAARAPAFRSISAATRLVAECFAHALGVLLSHEANWWRKFMSRIFSRQISPR